MCSGLNLKNMRMSGCEGGLFETALYGLYEKEFGSAIVKMGLQMDFKRICRQLRGYYISQLLARNLASPATS